MKNIKSFYFPGQVVEIKPIKYLENNKCVINIVTSFTQELVAGFEETIEKTIVLFSRKAAEAEANIEEGDFVVFSGCRLNPREYTTLAGSHVEVVDVLAEQFQVVAESSFETICAKLKEKDLVPSADDLAFTEAHSNKLAAEARLAAKINPLTGELITGTEVA